MQWKRTLFQPSAPSAKLKDGPQHQVLDNIAVVARQCHPEDTMAILVDQQGDPDSDGIAATVHGLRVAWSSQQLADTCWLVVRGTGLTCISDILRMHSVDVSATIEMGMLKCCCRCAGCSRLIT